MDLTVRPLQLSELDTFTQVYWDAFEPLAANMILPMLYPNGLQPDLAARLRSRVLRNTKGDLVSHCFCAVDSSSGEITGVSWWATVKDSPKSALDIQTGFDEAYVNRNVGEPVAGFNAELDLAFFKAAFFSEAEVMSGGPYISLRILAVSPKHQRRGVGAVLLRHGLQKADQLGLPVYLDSGISGKALYERYGFEAVRDFPLDCTKYGGRSDGRHWCMVRPAKQSS